MCALNTYLLCLWFRRGFRFFFFALLFFFCLSAVGRRPPVVLLCPLAAWDDEAAVVLGLCMMTSRPSSSATWRAATWRGTVKRSSLLWMLRPFCGRPFAGWEGGRYVAFCPLRSRSEFDPRSCLLYASDRLRLPSGWLLR